jgi:undecaprenyl diphosphate synthase
MFFKKKVIQTPAHVAFICDGNRRWATLRGRPAVWGYDRGAQIVDAAAEYMIGHGVAAVSFFLFSTENWSRPADEVKCLRNKLAADLPAHADRAHRQNIRVKFVGRRDRFSKSVVKMFEKIEKQTDENTAGTIIMALDYGGMDEIVRAANAAVTAGVATDADAFETFMDTGEIPPIDLVVRTSREMRISNFMLWKMAYAELMFYPKYWPALRGRDFAKMLREYNVRKRRFGG